eukprot:GHVS01030955.1.p1 GENE.GHVS01030955.1~~GHVS01030955.1.p1  ORF type:complete len:113 (+),score=15.01 GHVS01030955.1:377-715(+)
MQRLILQMLPQMPLSIPHNFVFFHRPSFLIVPFRRPTPFCSSSSVHLPLATPAVRLCLRDFFHELPCAGKEAEWKIASVVSWDDGGRIRGAAAAFLERVTCSRGMSANGTCK